MERFEEVFKAAIQGMHQENVRAYGSLMAYVMLPGLEALKPVFKATYDQGVKDEQEKLEGCVVVPVEMPDSFDDALYMYSNDISVVNSESDGFIPMADLDHGKVWQLVVEAARGGK